MKPVSRYRRRETILCVLIAAVLLVTYAPLFQAQYGYGDDFVLLLSEKPLEYAYLKDGRPLFALAQLLVHRPIQQLDQFGYLRLAGCIAVAAITLLLFKQVRRLGGTRIEHAALAIGIGTLPCLHTYVAQANFWLAPLAGLCVLLAAMLTFRATESVTAPGGLFSPRFLPPLILMLIASAAYQPMLSWYWTITMVYLLDRRFISSADHRRQVYYVIAMGLAFFVICFIAFKLYFVIFGSLAKQRTQLTKNPFEKLYWFARIQLPLALNFWHLFDSSKRLLTLGLAGLSMTVIIGGYAVSCLRLAKRTSPTKETAGLQNPIVLRTILLVVVVLLTHVHWLAIAIDTQSYRIIASLGVAMLILMYWSLRQLSALIPGSRTRVRVRQLILILVALVAVVVCQRYSVKYWIGPHTTAYRFMLHTMRDGITDDIDHIHLVRQGTHDGYVSEWFIESFGRPATERDWTIELIVGSALRDSGVSHRIETVTHGSGSDPIPADAGTLVIDMRTMVRFRL